MPASRQAAGAAAHTTAATGTEEDALAGDYAASYNAMKEMMEIKLRHESQRADYLQVRKKAYCIAALRGQLIGAIKIVWWPCAQEVILEAWCTLSCAYQLAQEPCSPDFTRIMHFNLRSNNAFKLAQEYCIPAYTG
jgi:hypothetical protein